MPAPRYNIFHRTDVSLVSLYSPMGALADGSKSSFYTIRVESLFILDDMRPVQLVRSDVRVLPLLGRTRRNGGRAIGETSRLAGSRRLFVHRSSLQ